MATVRNNNLYKTLEEALLESANPRKELAQVSLENIGIVDEVIKLAEKLANKNQKADANRLIEIAKKILANNKRLQNMVGKVSDR